MAITPNLCGTMWVFFREPLWTDEKVGKVGETFPTFRHNTENTHVDQNNYKVGYPKRSCKIGISFFGGFLGFFFQYLGK